MDTSQLLKGVLDLAVLAALRDGSGYGYDIARRLKAAGIKPVGNASVYGSLRRLLSAGLLQVYDVDSNEGPQRRYYVLTERGRAELDRDRQVWQEFSLALDRLLRVNVGNE